MLKFIVPAIILVGVIAFGFIMLIGESDMATGASSEAMLRQIGLPKDLPTLVEPGGGGDVTEDYHKAIDLYVDKADFLQSNPPPKELVDRLVELIVRQGRKGAVTQGWADKYVDLRPGSQPNWYSAPMKIADIVLEREVQTQIKGEQFTGSKAEARRAIDAVYLFGKRMYESNDRVLIRRDGLKTMEKALYYRELLLEDKKAAQWREAIGQTLNTWEQKLRTIYEFDASVADLIRFAELDEDEGFRIEAILQLGVAKWTRRSRGNARVIDSALEGLAGSKNADIAAAAKAALALKRDDVHKAY